MKFYKMFLSLHGNNTNTKILGIYTKRGEVDNFSQGKIDAKTSRLCDSSLIYFI